MPRFLARAAGLVHHGGVNVIAVKVVRLLSGLEPDGRPVGQAQEQFALVGDVKRLGQPVLHAAEGDLGLRIDRRDPPVVMPLLALNGLFEQPSDAGAGLARLGAGLNEGIAGGSAVDVHTVKDGLALLGV